MAKMTRTAADQKEGTMKLEDHYTLLPSSITARFEAGKPADPTKHMSEEDAQKWKEMNDKHRDKFKKKADSKSDLWGFLSIDGKELLGVTDSDNGNQLQFWTQHFKHTEADGQPVRLTGVPESQAQQLLAQDWVKMPWNKASIWWTNVKQFAKKASAGRTAAWMEWKKYENSPVEVATEKGTKVYPNLAAVQEDYPNLDPAKGGDGFHWAMRGEVKGQPAIRFETAQVYKALSRDASKQAAGQTTTVKDFVAHILKENDEKEVAEILKELKQPDHGDYGEQFEHWSKADFAKAIDELGKHGKQAAAKVDRIGKGKNGYICRYKGKTVEVMADTTYAAQQAAQAYFKAKNGSDISTMLAEKDGKQVTHDPAILASKQATYVYEQGMRAAALSLEAAWGLTAEEEGLTAEGCPDNLEGEDCDKWEANTDKYKDVVKDKHKQAGCEKLPEALRDNCEKKQDEGKEADKKEASSKTASRPLHEIAREIRRDWVKPYFGAVPYMQAMSGLGDISESYGAEDASEIVARFLGNASAWKGEVAKRIKAELNAMLKSGRRASEDAEGLEAAWGPMLAGDEDDEGKDADWEEGHVGPPESGPGGERSEEGSDTPDGSDNLAKRACGEEYSEDEEDEENLLAEMLREGKFEEGKPADPTKDMSEEDAAEWKKQNEEHKDQFKSARVRLTANYMAHHYTTPDGKVYADTSFLTACNKLPGVSVEHMGFGEFYADTPKGRVDFDRMRGKEFPEQVGRSHQVYGENHAEKWLIAEMEKRNLSQDMTGTAVTASDKTANAEMFKQIGPGDRVTIETRHGNLLTGRAVMRGPHGWVLNLGGAHGTPGIADESNIVKVVKAKTPGPRFANTKSAAPNTVQGWLEWED